MDDTYPGHPDPELDAGFYAGVPIKRAIAWLADSVLIGMLVLIAIPFTFGLGLLMLPMLWLGIGLMYRIVSISSWSATPGMRFMAIEFRNRYGARFTTAEAATHTVIYTTGIVFALIHLISIVLMLTGAKKQGIPDHALGSVAINRPTE